MAAREGTSLLRDRRLCDITVQCLKRHYQQVTGRAVSLSMTNDSGLRPGDAFGHLTIIDPDRRITRPTGSRSAALCGCDCGNDKIVSLNHLVSGRVTSCGCRARNVARITVDPGSRSGSFTVLAEADRDRRGGRRVRIVCDCGTVTTRSVYAVTNGTLTHCGGPAHRLPVPQPKPELVRRYQTDVHPGDRFSMRVVVEAGLTDRHGRRAARVRCDCGTEQVIAVRSLIRWKSCGHIRPGNPRHGMCYHPLFEVHKAMMSRCYREASKDYRNYGARGIRVHKPWHDVRVFIADIEAEIGPRPDGRYPSGWSLYTLDRIDNDGNYEPGNVRWSTRLEQAHNKRPKIPARSPADPAGTV
jgi:hypothetical protein